MKKHLRLGAFDLYWLDGGKFGLDGGAMFGVVPKKIWIRKYPADEENFIPLVAWPILVKTPGALLLIETGIGNKLTEKQRRIFRIKEEWQLPRDLHGLGIRREDIDYVILTHGDFDHAGGIVMNHDGDTCLTFPRARHLMQKMDWDDVRNPNKRAENSYWPINFEGLAESENLVLAEDSSEIVPGVTLIRTGGHHRGHQMVRLESEGNVAFHMGDLFPTHAHYNPLWVMAYDDYPLDTIRLKEEWQAKAREQNALYLFYHDPFVQCCRFDEEGKVIKE